MDFSVRPMTPDDAHAVAQVHVQVWREAYDGLMPADYLAGLEVGRYEAYWRRTLEEQPVDQVRIVGTDHDDRVVGIAAAGPSGDDDAPTLWRLFMINVLREAHGTGLADQMMEQLVGDRDAHLWVVGARIPAGAALWPLDDPCRGP